MFCRLPSTWSGDIKNYWLPAPCLHSKALRPRGTPGKAQYSGNINFFSWVGEWLQVVLPNKENQGIVIASDCFASSCNSNERETLGWEKGVSLMDNLWVCGVLGETPDLVCECRQTSVSKQRWGSSLPSSTSSQLPSLPACKEALTAGCFFSLLFACS